MCYLGFAWSELANAHYVSPRNYVAMIEPERSVLHDRSLYLWYGVAAKVARYADSADDSISTAQIMILRIPSFSSFK